jgi:deaminated glutathione amidase
MAGLTVATCQFPVSADVEGNLRWIKRQLGQASRRGARVAHFPEGALSGYAGVDFGSFDGFGWERLLAATGELAAQCGRLGLWAVVGSAHPLGDGRKPHNSMFVIDDGGRIVARYDKRFCSGDPEGRSGDLAHYRPGEQFTTWDIDGVRCGAQICHDYRYPELYREYSRLGAQVMFHSFHAGGVPAERVAAITAAIGPGYTRLNPSATCTYPGITMPAAMTTAAACNHMWISAPNSSARESLWPAFFVRADGVTTGRLRRNTPGVLISDVDTDEELYDSTRFWRRQAIAGVLHSGVHTGPAAES